MNRTLVVLSGGQDSTTCLMECLTNTKDEIFTISFYYGQRHEVELECVQDILSHVGVPADHSIFVEIPNLANIVQSSLLTTDTNINQKQPDRPNLPSSFVPNRNALFLTLAHAYAQKIHASTIVTGVNQTDYSGYPDCRGAFIESINTALNIGSNSNIHIETPLLLKSKAQIWEIAFLGGYLDLITVYTHTCYNGDRMHMYEWGHGCNKCPACRIRSESYYKFKRAHMV